MHEFLPHPASYRDAAGFIFRSGASWYRQVNNSYAEDYDHLLSSGLYRTLTEKKMLIPHTETGGNLTGQPDWYKTLQPQQLPFITYPGEWSPAQLKDAALLTLDILRIALDHGMILKDATPFNVQFPGGRPLFIDTLSFEKYDGSSPWVAYRQFCESFLFPLYLQHYLSTGTQKIMNAYPEGIPAAVTAQLLPWKSRWRLGVWLHVLLPGKIRDDGHGRSGRPMPFSREKMLRLVSHLTQILRELGTDNAPVSAWSNYYEHTIISGAYLAAKEKIFREFIGNTGTGSALDLGANDGYFSKILAEHRSEVIAIDTDWQCINNLYQFTREQRVTNILPLCVDVAAPTPATGFHNAERASFSARVSSDLVVALALLHHLVLSKNIPLAKIAAYFSELTQNWLIVEFVPLTDEKAIDLIRNKKSYHSPYDIAFFQDQFNPWFTIEKQERIHGTERTLFLMKKRVQAL